MDGRAAEEVLLHVEAERQLAQNPSRGGGDLRPDAVAGEKRDFHSGELVTAPSEADETRAAYLAKTPVT